MRCAACGAENPESARFCEQCGVAMESRCAYCGATARQGARFCVACGRPLQTGPPPIETTLEPPTPAPQMLDPTAAVQAFQPPTHLADKIRAQHFAMEGERRQVT